MAKTRLTLPQGFASLLNQLKEPIRAAQVRAALAVNGELVSLYWTIGPNILARQKGQAWEATIVDRLAADRLPRDDRLLASHLKCMRAFAEACPGNQFVQQFAAQIPLFHSCVMLDWSRNLLFQQIEIGLHAILIAR
jgi:uncharacterized protein DUF1016